MNFCVAISICTCVRIPLRFDLSAKMLADVAQPGQIIIFTYHRCHLRQRSAFAVKKGSQRGAFYRTRIDPLRPRLPGMEERDGVQTDLVGMIPLGIAVLIAIVLRAEPAPDETEQARVDFLQPGWILELLVEAQGQRRQQRQYLCLAEPEVRLRRLRHRGVG